MAKIIEVLPLISNIRNKIQEKASERRELSVIALDTFDSSFSINSNVDKLTEEINKLISDLSNLLTKIAQANDVNTVDFFDMDEQNGTKLTVSKALTLVKLWRDELSELKKLSKRQPTRLVQGYPGNSSFYEFATYDTEKYKILALQLEKNINCLSSAIDLAGYEYEIDFDISEYM